MKTPLKKQNESKITKIGFSQRELKILWHVLNCPVNKGLKRLEKELK